MAADVTESAVGATREDLTIIAVEELNGLLGAVRAGIQGLSHFEFKMKT